MGIEQRRNQLPFDPQAFLEKVGEGRTIAEYQKNHLVFAQGDSADAVFYIQRGKIKLAVTSKSGKEAILAILGANDFFGESCLTGQPVRLTAANSPTKCSLVRIPKKSMLHVIRNEPAFSTLFTTHLLSRIMRVEADLVDHLFNSSEKRLARILLLLANFGKDTKPEPVLAHISQDLLAEMVGTTRPRINLFLNKFRKLGFIEYNGSLAVHSSLLNILLYD